MGVEKSSSSFKCTIAAKWLEIDENVSRARLIRHFLALKVKHQMSERRSNTIRAVVERPDHHCSDDLVGWYRVLRVWAFITTPQKGKLSTIDIFLLTLPDAQLLYREKAITRDTVFVFFALQEEDAQHIITVDGVRCVVDIRQQPTEIQRR